MFYLTTHSTHFIYSYMASDIWLRTILIVKKETRCRHIGYSFRLTARVILYAPSHRQDSTYDGLCYTSRGALAGTRNSSWVHRMKDRSDDPSHHEQTLLPRRYISLLCLPRDLGRKEMFYVTTHTTHFIYGYMASDIWLRTNLIVRKETRCRHIDYSFRLDRVAHTTAFVTPVVEHWLEQELAQWVHPMKDRPDDPSHNERTLLPRICLET